VVGTQARFYMTYRDLLIESCECGGSRSGCVTVHQYHIRFRLVQHITHPGQHTGGYIIQILPLLHDVQVIIRLDIEYLQHLIEHFTMLPRHADDCFKVC
jgi:hypothetical protein